MPEGLLHADSGNASSSVICWGMPRPLPSDVKAQSVRLWDVFLIGPLMIWGGALATPKQPLPGLALTLAGMGTIVLNGVNFRRIERRKKRYGH